MEYIWLVYLILAVALLLYGFSQFIGFGWAMFIFDLMTHGHPHDYADFQKNSPPTKDGNKRTIGLITILVGFVFGYLVVRSLEQL